MRTVTPTLLKSLTALKEYHAALDIQKTQFFEAPEWISEETLVSLCYCQVLDGYWDTSGETTVFKVIFSEREVPPVPVKKTATKKKSKWSKSVIDYAQVPKCKPLHEKVKRVRHKYKPALRFRKKTLKCISVKNLNSKCNYVPGSVATVGILEESGNWAIAYVDEPVRGAF